MYRSLVVILFLFLFFNVSAQEAVKDTIAENNENYLAAVKPVKVAFYSAILPGLGQAHNRDYWKIPLVYVALGSGVYFYVENDKNYNKYRTAYKLLKLGEENDYPGVSASVLERAQKYHKKYRDLSFLVTTGLYVLQIVEATVDAHLYYHNVDEELTVTPFVRPDDFLANEQVVGIALIYSF